MSHSLGEVSVVSEEEGQQEEEKRVCMSMYERGRVREQVRGSENSAQAFPVFPWPTAVESHERGLNRGRGKKRHWGV